MSRTDIHRPYWVMMQDPTIRHWFKDVHQHEAGVCDFVGGPWLTGTKPNCYREIWTQCPNLCGCGLCVGQFGRKYKRRQERRLWQQVQRKMLKTPVQDLETIDPDLRRASTYWG